MRIDSSKWVHMPQAYERTQKVEGTDQKKSGKVDQVSISSEARARFEDTETSRSEKINALRQAIEDGTYKPDPVKIAERFLRL
ncbi:flagellar biosynthesis anti-sigma factor FlgM [Exiguobacterium flavidum]|uniref:flagellar biosynthesis anti-sigma factor FlgM n=1 Tax=Exiguobacterium flavidum TaxID=2184695 RepID=UPI000DF85E9A|nr:flagellar biosynthesis anti-sigma factor FlgM [Exiguobacterium flavidum]